MSSNKSFNSLVPSICFLNRVRCLQTSLRNINAPLLPFILHITYIHIFYFNIDYYFIILSKIINLNLNYTFRKLLFEKRYLHN